MDIRRGLTYKPEDVQENGIRVLRSSNIKENKFSITSDDVFVNTEVVNMRYAKEGDILITSANGSNKLVGKHALIKNIDGKAIHGGFMLLAETNNPHFINASMTSDWYKKFITLHVSGGNGAIGNLSKTDLENYLFYIPTTEEEQTQIGELFQSVDNLITLHQRELF